MASIFSVRLTVRVDIYRVSTDYNSNTTDLHRNALLPHERSNNVPKPDPNTASKPNLDITQYTPIQQPIESKYQHPKF